MDKLVQIKLIKKNKTNNDIGEPIITETETEIFGSLSSVTRDEWFSAYRSDFNAKHRIKVYDFEYHDEEVAELNGKRYSIYRTFYSGGDKVELYLSEKGGVK